MKFSIDDIEREYPAAHLMLLGQLQEVLDSNGFTIFVSNWREQRANGDWSVLYELFESLGLILTIEPTSTGKRIGSINGLRLPDTLATFDHDEAERQLFMAAARMLSAQTNQ